MIKTAKLFEAGEYPDKGLTITLQDLDRIAERFRTCPIKIEHIDSPFDGVLGKVMTIFRKGRELFGKIDFIKEAWDLIEKAQAKSLSVCIDPTEKTIKEVSIVKKPRVKDAKVFTFSLNFTEDKMTDYEALIEENKRLKENLALIEAEKQADKYFREGKLTPATKDLAVQLFKCESEIKFGEDYVPITSLFASFLEKLPSQVTYSEIEKPVKKKNNNYSEEQIEYARKLGVNLEDK